MDLFPSCSSTSSIIYAFLDRVTLGDGAASLPEEKALISGLVFVSPLNLLLASAIVGILSSFISMRALTDLVRPGFLPEGFL